MAGYRNIEIAAQLRPCYADGQKAVFHKWIEAPITGGCINPEDICKFLMNANTTMGLVELEDGTIHKCLPENIQFCDSKFQQYTFPKE